MRKSTKILIVVLLIVVLLALGVLKALGKVGWVLVLAPLWIPLAFLYGLVVFFFALYIIGLFQKRKEKIELSKIPHICDNCLFHASQEIIGEEQCFGEKMGATKEENTCPYFHLTANPKVKDTEKSE